MDLMMTKRALRKKAKNPAWFRKLMIRSDTFGWRRTLLRGIIFLIVVSAVIMKDVQAAAHRRLGSLTDATLSISDQTHGATVTANFEFKTFGAIPVNGKISFEFPSPYSDESLSSLSLDSVTGLGGSTSMSRNGRVVKITLSGNPEISSETDVAVTFGGIKLPPSSSVKDNYKITTLEPDEDTIDTVDIPQPFVIQPGSLVAAMVPSSSTAGRTTKYTLNIQLSNDLPADGTIFIQFPATFPSLSGASLNSMSGMDGSVSVVPNEKVLSLVRSGGSAASGGDSISVEISGIINPTTPGNSGTYPSIYTATNDNLIIDQANTVSGSIIDAVSILLSKNVIVGTESGSTVDYTIILNCQPLSDVTIDIVSSSSGDVSVSPSQVIFDSGNWNSARTITVTFEEDSSVDGTLNINLSHSASSTDPLFNALSDSQVFQPDHEVSVVVHDNDSPFVVLSKTSLNVLEGSGSESYSIELGSKPSADVVVSIADDFSGRASASPNSITFTPADWNTPQQVAVSAVDDSVAQSTASFTLTHSCASSDTNYNGQVEVIPSSSLIVSVDDSDIPSVIFSEMALSIPEGSTGYYSMVLSSEPTSLVTIDIDNTASGSRTSVTPAQITFDNTNWNTKHNITVTATNDETHQDVYQYAIGHSISSSDVQYNTDSSFATGSSVNVKIMDNDLASVVLSSVQTVIGEGYTWTYSFNLESKPAHDVTITLTSSAGITLNTSSVVVDVNSWDIPQYIQVTALKDDQAHPSGQSATIQHSTTSIDPHFQNAQILPDSTVSITITDSDTAAISISENNLFIKEGETTTYSIVLLSEPSADVSVTISTTPSVLSVTPSSTITFTSSNWASAQVVTVLAVDNSIDSSEPIDSSITHSASSADANFDGSSARFYPVNGEVLVSVYDDDIVCINPCAPGSYSINYNQEQVCVTCPLGFFCLGGCNSPTPCMKGTYRSTAGASASSACLNCDEGYYASQVGSDLCTQCPAGHSCEDKTASPEACIGGSYSEIESQSCTVCPPGYKCPAPSVAPVVCPSGYYSLGNSTDCTICPPGSRCPSTDSSPIQCNTGEYAVSAGSISCTTCEPGYNCSDPAIVPAPCDEGYYSDNGVCTMCPAGYECYAGSDISPCPTGTYSDEFEDVCTDCEPSFFCPPGASQPLPCEVGSYSLSKAIICTNCTAGFACGTGKASPTECPDGTYSLDLAVNCISCPEGMKCPLTNQAPEDCLPGTFSTGLQKDCTPCSQGSYTTQNNSIQCDNCPPGYKCPRADEGPTACSSGTYALAGSTECSICPTGKQCPKNDEEPLDCPQGWYSVQSSTACTICPAGQFCSSPSVPPQDCATAHYSNPGQTSCDPCPAGSSCPTPSQNPIPCDEQSYSTEAFSACILCPAGHECPARNSTPVQCSQGKYSAEGDVQCYPCPAGSKCPTQSEGPIACENGEWSGEESVSCTRCPPGHECPTTYQPPVECNSGYYATGNQTSCTPTSPGFFASSKSSVQQPCSAGSYSAGLATSCTPCQPGFKCPSTTGSPVACTSGTFATAGSDSCTECTPGHYCPQPDANLQIPCQNGSYALSGSSNCTSCPSGHACPYTTSDDRIPCPPGSFSVGGQASCTSCPPGDYCPNSDGSLNGQCALGSFSTGSATQCTPCPAGYACPDTDRVETQQECLKGFYSLEGHHSCTGCPNGHACPDTTSSNHISCAGGTFSVGEQDHCTICPPGNYCPSTNTSDTFQCAPGYYSTGSAVTCTICPAGSKCSNSSTSPIVCESGYYSTEGSTSCVQCPPGHECHQANLLPQPCPVGYWSPGGSSGCTLCDPGYRCSLGSTNPTPPSDACEMGTYCNPASSKFLCPSGTFGNTTAGTSVDHACHECPEGYYCLAGSTPLTKEECRRGYYCPPGTKRQGEFPCPAGTYNPNLQAISDSECIDCPAGSYCPIGSISPQICPAGYYCELNTRSATQFPCPTGYYSGQSGLSSASECTECETGAYCPSGSVDPIDCPAGTYNSVRGAGSIHNCEQCPPGYTCPNIGQTVYNESCQAGHYCPLGTAVATAYPCPAGTFTDSLNLIDHQDCTDCPPGKACPSGTGGDVSPKLDCAQGHYCPARTQHVSQFDCPPGTYTASTQLTAADECTSCPNGQYCEGGQNAPDGDCPVGHFCPMNTTSATEFPCPTGTYSDQTKLFDASQCQDCPAGSWCASGVNAPSLCPAGTYSSQTNTENPGPGTQFPSCIECPAGYFCVEGGVIPVECGAGFYSDARAAACDTCPSGYYCSSNTTSKNDMLTGGGYWQNNANTSGQCFNGTYCSSGTQVIPDLSSFACAKGHYCPTSTQDPIPCPAGTYNPHHGKDDESDCIPAEAGYYSVQGSSSVTGECLPGYYCPSGSTSNQSEPCPARYYRSNTKGTNENDCSVCTAGNYCPQATSNPQICPPGFYCVTGTDIPEPCPIGTYGDTEGLSNVESCKPCDPGWYCDGTALTSPRGQCDPGYFCTSRSYTSAPFAPGAPQLNVSSDIGGPCTAGGYCQSGSSIPQQCPIGTYNDKTGSMSDAECSPCPPGFYCSSPGLEEPSGPCAAGFFCTGSATAPTQFSSPVGYYSHEGATHASQCEPGTYNSQVEQSNCTSCPSRKYCPGFGGITPQDCPPGSYCPERSKWPTPCPKGTYSNKTGLLDVSECTDCSLGKFCETNGLLEPSGDCLGGYFCVTGSPYPNPNDPAYGEPCPTGKYCPIGSYRGTDCPIGTYLPYTHKTNESDCIDCDGGSYCDTLGLSNVAGNCDPGYFCTGGAEKPNPTDGDTGNICPAGHECPAGSTIAHKCSAGSYSPKEGSANCMGCPSGNYCDGLDTTVYQECPVGHYCPVNTTADIPPCPRGTFSNSKGNAELNDCISCTAGNYCESTGLTAPSGTCSAGHYCEEGSINRFGGNDSANKKICPAGAYCESGSYEPTYCPDGTFSENDEEGKESIDDCGACPKGKYCRMGLEVASDCASGYVCFGKAAVPNPTDGVTGKMCESGFYCPPGSDVELKCPNGTYNSMPGKGACNECPAGSFCSEGSQNPSICPVGSYCPEKSSTNLKCPPGTYGNVESLENAQQCLPCEPGKYCKNGNVTNICHAGYYCASGCSDPQPNGDSPHLGGPCPTGHYCSNGTSVPTPCPDGTSGINTHADSVNYCIPCPAGMDCSVGWNSKDCPRGHYCPEKIGPIPCEPGTFNPSTGGSSSSSCTMCRAGFLCNRSGTTNESILAPPGHYTLEGSSTALPCPPKTFNPDNGASGLNNCTSCPEAHFCPSGTIIPLECSAGTFCPPESANPTICTAGHYCPNNTSTPIPCPQGHYCPRGATDPIQCQIGQYCPAASSFYLPCPLGYKGRKTPLHGIYAKLEDSCEVCPKGTFGAHANRSQCETCTPGYVCKGNTTTPRPEREGLENGYSCPKGHFCEAGSSEEVPCPAGTFNPNYNGKNISFCEPCKEGFAQHKEGQSSCYECSTSSTSVPGSKTCTCRGNHRAYQPTDGFCICEPGYEFYDVDLIRRSDEDGSIDCQPIVYDRCSSGEVRSDNGKCVPETSVDCSKACPSLNQEGTKSTSNASTGKYISGLGICQCENQQVLDDFCDQDCRSNSAQIRLKPSGSLELYGADGEPMHALTDVIENKTFLNAASCNRTSGDECKIYPIVVQDGGFQGTYDAETITESGRQRRLVEADTTSNSKPINNPVICLSKGDGLLFELSGGPNAYPMYLKDSMLNSNPGFDYGQFREVGRRMSSENRYSHFAFTFHESGTYVFGNNNNTDAKTIIKVMEEGIPCQTAPILPLVERNLIQLNVKANNEDIILAPNWYLIGGLLIGLFCMVAGIIGGLYYFRKRSWASKTAGTASYRSKSKNARLSSANTKGSVFRKQSHGDIDVEDTIGSINKDSIDNLDVDALEKAQKGISSSDESIMDLDRWDDEDIDIRELVERLQYHHDSVTKSFQYQEQGTNRVLHSLRKETDELKRLLATSIATGASSCSNAPGMLNNVSPQVTQESRDTSLDTLLVHLHKGLVDREDFEMAMKENLECVLKTVVGTKSLGGVDSVDPGVRASRILNQISESPSLDMLDATFEDDHGNENSGLEHAVLGVIGPIRNSLETLSSQLSKKVEGMNGTTCSSSTKSIPACATQNLWEIYSEEKRRKEVEKTLWQAYPISVKSKLPHGAQQQLSRLHELENVLDHHWEINLTYLSKLGEGVSAISEKMMSLGENFAAQYLRTKEEQNPAKIRKVFTSFEGKLAVILKELFRAGSKVGSKHNDAFTPKQTEFLEDCKKVRDQLRLLLEGCMESRRKLEIIKQQEILKSAMGNSVAMSQMQSLGNVPLGAASGMKDQVDDQQKIAKMLTKLQNFIPNDQINLSNKKDCSTNATNVQQSGKFTLKDAELRSLEEQMNRIEHDEAQDNHRIDQMRKNFITKLDDELQSSINSTPETANAQLIIKEERDRRIADFEDDLAKLHDTLHLEREKRSEELRNRIAARELMIEQREKLVENDENTESEILQRQEQDYEKLQEKFDQEQNQIDNEVEAEFKEELEAIERLQNDSPRTEQIQAKDIDIPTTDSLTESDDDNAMMLSNRSDETVRSSPRDFTAKMEELQNELDDATTSRAAQLDAEAQVRKQALQARRTARRLENQKKLNVLQQQLLDVKSKESTQNAREGNSLDPSSNAVLQAREQLEEETARQEAAELIESEKEEAEMRTIEMDLQKEKDLLNEQASVVLETMQNDEVEVQKLREEHQRQSQALEHQLQHDRKVREKLLAEKIKARRRAKGETKSSSEESSASDDNSSSILKGQSVDDIDDLDSASILADDTTLTEEEIEEKTSMMKAINDVEASKRNELLENQDKDMDELRRKQSDDTSKNTKDAEHRVKQLQSKLDDVKTQHAKDLDALQLSLSQDKSRRQESLKAKIAARKQKCLQQREQAKSELEKQKIAEDEIKLIQEEEAAQKKLHQELEEKEKQAIKKEIQRQQDAEQQLKDEERRVAAAVAAAERIEAEREKKEKEQRDAAELSRIQSEYNTESKRRLEDESNEIKLRKKALKEKMASRKRAKRQKLEEKRLKAEQDLLERQRQEALAVQSRLEENEMKETWEQAIDDMMESSEVQPTTAPESPTIDPAIMEKKHQEELQKLLEEQEMEAQKALSEASKRQEEEMQKELDQKRIEMEKRLADAANEMAEEELSRIKEDFNVELAQNKQALENEKAKKKQRLRKRIEEKKKKQQAALKMQQEREKKEEEKSATSPSADEDAAMVREREKQKELITIQQLLASGTLPSSQILQAIEKVLSRRHNREKDAIALECLNKRTEKIRESMQKLLDDKMNRKRDANGDTDMEARINHDFDVDVQDMERRIEQESDADKLKALETLQAHHDKEIKDIYKLLAPEDEVQEMQATIPVGTASPEISVGVAASQNAPFGANMTHDEQKAHVECMLLEYKSRLENEKAVRISNVLSQTEADLQSIKFRCRQSLLKLDVDYSKKIENEKRLAKARLSKQIAKINNSRQDQKSDSELEGIVSALEAESAEQEAALLTQMGERREKERFEIAERMKRRLNSREQACEKRIQVIETKTQEAYAAELIRQNNRLELVWALQDNSNSENVTADRDKGERNQALSHALKKKKSFKSLGLHPQDIENYLIETGSPLKARENRKQRRLERQQSRSTNILQDDQTCPEDAEAVLRGNISIEDRLVQTEKLIERLLKQNEDVKNRKNEDDVLNAIAAAHQGTLQDAERDVEGVLEEISDENLGPRHRVRLKFMRKLLEHLDIGLDDLRLMAAKSLPKSSMGNAFKNSMYYDKDTATLYVRYGRMENASELASIVMHAVTHIKFSRSLSSTYHASDMINTEEISNSDPRFVTEFHRMMGKCYQVFFQMSQVKGEESTKMLSLRSMPNDTDAWPQNSTDTGSVSESSTVPEYFKQDKLNERINKLQSFLDHLSGDTALSLSDGEDSEDGGVISARNSARFGSRDRIADGNTMSSGHSMLRKRGSITADEIDDVLQQHLDDLRLHSIEKVQDHLDKAEKLYTDALRECTELSETLELLKASLIEAQHEGNTEEKHSIKLQIPNVVESLNDCRSRRDKISKRCEDLRDILDEKVTRAKKDS